MSTAKRLPGRKSSLTTPTNPIAILVVPPRAVTGRRAPKLSTKSTGTRAMSFLSPVPSRAGKGLLFDALVARRMTVGTLDQSPHPFRKLMNMIHNLGEGGQLAGFYKKLKNGDKFDLVVRNYKKA